MPVQVTHNNDGHFYTIDVDLAKEGAEVFDLTTYFKARVADNNVGLRFRWFWQGQVFNTVGKKPRVVGLVGQYSFKKADNGINRELIMSPDASAVAFTGDVNDCEPGGYATYYFPEQMFPQDGMFKGTVGLLDDSGETARYTSVDIWFKVYPQAGGAQMGKACDYYISELDKTIKEAEDDLLNSKKSMQKVVDEFVSKMNDLTNKLATQGNTDQAALEALEQKIKQDGLFTQAEADVFKQAIDEKVSIVLDSYGLNVKLFGAVGDGTTDDTKAFQTVLDKAENGSIKRILLPDGKYLITKPLVIPDNVDLIGIGNRMKTTVIPKGIGYLFEVGSRSLLNNFSVEAVDNGKDIILLKLGGFSRGVNNSNIKNLYLHGSSAIKVYGIATATSGSSANIFETNVQNVTAEIMYDGLKLSSSRQTWINGNSFRDVTIIGFAHSAVYLTSSETGSLNIAQNLFSNIQFEAIPEAEGTQYDQNDIIGIRVEFGDRNKFTMLHGWDDDGKAVKALSVIPNEYTTNYNNYRDNVFDGYFEAEIVTNWYTAHNNNFSGLKIHKFNGRMFKGYSQLNFTARNSVKNLISDDLISNKVIGHDVPIFSSKNSPIIASYDMYGAFLQVNSNSGEMYIPLEGNDRNLITGLGKITVGFDIRFDDNESYNNVDLRAGLVNFMSGTTNRMDSNVYKREIAVDESGYGFRIIANINVGNVDAYDVHALSIAWSGLAEGHLKVVRFFVVANEIGATQKILQGRASNPWTVSRAPGAINNFNDMFLTIIPGELVSNPLTFDPNLVEKKTMANGTEVVSYPLWY